MKPNILILAGGQIAYHNYPESARVLAATLREVDLPVTISHDPQVVDQLSQYTALVLFTDGDYFTDQQLASIIAFVQSGKGLISIHTAAGTNKAHRGFSELIGSQIQGGVITPHEAIIEMPDHPFVQGISHFELDDEIHDLLPITPFETLMSAMMNGKKQPLAYVKSHGAGTVIHFATGHSIAGLTNPNWRTIFVRAVKSVA